MKRAAWPREACWRPPLCARRARHQVWPPLSVGSTMRPGQLDEESLRGVPSPDPLAALAQAYAYLDKIHEAPCVDHRSITVLFKRVPTYGVSNDLNSIMRAFAVATRDRRQLVLLPPSSSARRKVEAIAGAVHFQRPWHWLEAGVPLASVLHPSACQTALAATHADALEALGANDTDAERLVEQVGLWRLRGRCRDYDTRNRWNLDLAPLVIPDNFRSNGMVWWMQVLTTYLLRVNGELASRVRGHPAMRAFATSHNLPQSDPIFEDWRVLAARSYTARLGPQRTGSSLFSSALFDVGLHVRMGDACGAKALRSAYRRCVRSLPDAVAKLAANGVRGGRVFLASD